MFTLLNERTLSAYDYNKMLSDQSPRDQSPHDQSSRDQSPDDKSLGDHMSGDQSLYNLMTHECVWSTIARVTPEPMQPKLSFF